MLPGAVVACLLAVLAGPVTDPVPPTVPASVLAGAAASTEAVLTSMPFGAGPGRRVTHTITLSLRGTGVLPAVGVTFTTTVDLDGVSATASPGHCPVVTPRKVTCVLGDLRVPVDAAAGPTITITGTVDPAAAPGALVQNLVSVAAAGSGPDAGHAVSNAYLVPGSASQDPQPAGAARVASRPAHPSGHPGTAPVVAALVMIIVLGGLLAIQRLRRRGAIAAGRL